MQSVPNRPVPPPKTTAPANNINTGVQNTTQNPELKFVPPKILNSPNASPTGTFRSNNNNKVLKPTSPMPSAPPPKFANQLGPRPNIPPPLPNTSNSPVLNRLNNTQSPTTTQVSPTQSPTETPTITVNSGTLRTNNSNNNNRGTKNNSRCYTINNNVLNLVQGGPPAPQEESGESNAAKTKTVHSIITMFASDPKFIHPLLPKRDDSVDDHSRRTSKRPLTEEEAMSRLSGASDFLKQRISIRRSNMLSTTPNSPLHNNNNNNNIQNDSDNNNNELNGNINEEQPVNPLEWWRQESTFYEYCSVDGTPIEPDGTRVRALWDFNAEKITDLSFNKGDILTIIRRYSNGWWEGELNGFIGDFPCNFVEEVDKDNGDDEVDPPSNNNNNNIDPNNSLAAYNNNSLDARPHVFSILQPLKQGFLTKKGQKRRNWKVRYFILEHGKISYYVAPNDHVQKKPLCTIYLLKSTVVKLAPEMKKSNCFAILSVRKPYTLYITAPTGEEMVSWMDCIESARGDGLL